MGDDVAHKNMYVQGTMYMSGRGPADLFRGFSGSTFISLPLQMASGHLCLGSKAGSGHGHPAPWVISQGLMSSLGMAPTTLPRRPEEGGRGRPRLAWSSWLIFLASIDPAASPESISSPRVKISPIVSPDLRQGGIHSNLFKQRKVFPSDLYSNLLRQEGGQGRRANPGTARAGPRPIPLNPPCQPGWQLVLPRVPGGGELRRKGGPQ